MPLSPETPINDENMGIMLYEIDMHYIVGTLHMDI